MWTHSLAPNRVLLHSLLVEQPNPVSATVMSCQHWEKREPNPQGRQEQSRGRPRYICKVIQKRKAWAKHASWWIFVQKIISFSICYKEIWGKKGQQAQFWNRKNEWRDKLKSVFLSVTHPGAFPAGFFSINAAIKKALLSSQTAGFLLYLSSGQRSLWNYTSTNFRLASCDARASNNLFSLVVARSYWLTSSYFLINWSTAFSSVASLACTG